MIRNILSYTIGSLILFVMVPVAMVYTGELFVYDFMPVNSLTFVFSSLCSASGLFFVIWSNYLLLKEGRGGAVELFGIEFTKKTEKLVTTGPYAMCRNPMHMGIILFYLGLSCAINSLITLLFPFLFLVISYLYAILVDEKRLHKDFKDEYEKWVQDVPNRFWPKTPRR